MKVKDLEGVEYPKCAVNCEMIKILGAGECENVCQQKFKEGKLTKEG